jgi:hypothetical protein
VVRERVVRGGEERRGGDGDGDGEESEKRFFTFAHGVD